MFEKSFNPEQKKSLLALSKRIAQSDNILTEEEEKNLSRIKKETGISNLDNGDFDFGQALKPFGNLGSQVKLMYELLSLTGADEELAEGEEDFIYFVADYFKIDQQKLEKIDGLVEKYGQYGKPEDVEKDLKKVFPSI
ncbi:MAG: hypothetical protein PHW04_07835 [Candidatus Wallbacteria bacterium]|nr:hypothetical protein [Candidatus Wallbacteria bacterium]